MARMNEHSARLLSLGNTYLVGNVTSQAIVFLLIPVYTAFLSISDYGIIALMSVTVVLVARFVSAPTSHAFHRHYYAPEYKQKQGVLVFNLFLWMFIKALLMGYLFWCARGYLATRLLNDSGLVRIVQLYTVILVLTPISLFFSSLLQMTERARYFVAVSISRSVLSAALILYLLIGLRLGVTAMVWGHLAGEVITIAMVFPVFLKLSVCKLMPSTILPALRYGYPLLISGYSNFLIQSADRFVLRLFCSVGTVGVYSFGYHLAGIVNAGLVMPLSQALHPVSFKQEEDPDQLRGFLRRHATYFWLVAVAVCLFVSLFSWDIVRIIARKEQFWQCAPVIPVIAFSYCLHGLLNFLGKGLVMAKKSWHSSGTIVLAAGTNLGLNFLFVPSWGIIGAAFATLVSYVVWNVLYAYCSAKFYNLHFEVGRLMHIAGVGVALYGLFLWIGDDLPLIYCLFIKGLLLLSFPAVLFATRFFKEEEKAVLRDIVTSLRRDGVWSVWNRLKRSVSTGGAG